MLWDRENRPLVGLVILAAILFGGATAYMALDSRSPSSAPCEPPQYVTQLGEAEGALDDFMTHAVLRRNVPAASVPARLEAVRDVITENIDLDTMEQFPSRESVPTIQSYSSLAAPPIETPSLVTVAIQLFAADVGMRTFVVKIARPCAGDEWKIDQWTLVRASAPAGGSVHPPSPR